ncbi:uncharacterized protein EI90DRAFT_1671818 [Cantharellus anzutake]|uniref:uncharacterized protein n=1 Tax=Cantharellus anzutake TaxID=1750568 RepID=UPI00190867D8|nr:uncharacterized protein EI90DRAFT_1671818 [Cantharellus anzutake]KAF8308721.1 hypothetical protein EI90DRAFT_1671818 [Cantharellus anzutake]
MSSHNRHHASAASRSRISALSQSLGFTSISSHPPNASTPRNLSPVQSRSSSPGPTQTHQQLSASLPSLPMQPLPFPAPSLSASMPNSSDMNDPPSPRSRSRSNASISSQMFPNVAASGPPPNAPAAIFAAGPGAYYAYPFFSPPPPSHVPSHTTAPSVGVNSGHHDAPGIGVGMGGLRTSYSSPHLPYLFDAGGLAAFHHHQQQQQQQERERQQRQQELEHQVSVAQAQQNLQNSSVELNDDDVTNLQPPPYGHHETTFSIGQPQVSTTSADSAPVQFPTPHRGTRAHSRSHGHLTLQTTSASVPLLSSSGPPSPSYYRSSGNPDSINGTNNTNARSRRPTRNAGSFSQQQPQHHQSDHPNRYDYLGADEGRTMGGMRGGR